MSGIPWGPGTETQDDFNVPTVFDVDRKIASINEFFNVNKSKVDKIYINFCSGVSNYGLVYPNFVAKRTNRSVLYHTGHLGVVAMDFPG